MQTHTVRNARLHIYADIDTIYTWKSVRKLYQTLLELSENAWKSAKDYLARLEFWLKTLAICQRPPGNLPKSHLEICSKSVKRTWKSDEKYMIYHSACQNQLIIRPITRHEKC